MREEYTRTGIRGNGWRSEANIRKIRYTVCREPPAVDSSSTRSSQSK